jgi:rhodanese-related sulfurtransferase
MKKLTLTPMAAGKIAVIAAGLSLVLLISQVAWTSGVEQITPAALANQLDTPTAPLILDVRSPAEYAQGHIPGAVNIPYREVPARVADLAAWQDAPIVVYCEVGVRAGIAELALEQAGFAQVLQLEGDMQAWRQAGLPLAAVSPKAQP